MERQSHIYEKPQMDVVLTNGGGGAMDDFGIYIAAINIAASVIEGNPEGGIF